MNAKCSRTARSEGSFTSLTWIVTKARYTVACRASSPVRTREQACRILLHFHGDPERGWSAYYSSFNESLKSLCHISLSDVSLHILNSDPWGSIAMPCDLSTTPSLRDEAYSTRVRSSLKLNFISGPGPIDFRKNPSFALPILIEALLYSYFYRLSFSLRPLTTVPQLAKEIKDPGENDCAQ